MAELEAEGSNPDESRLYEMITDELERSLDIVAHADRDSRLAELVLETDRIHEFVAALANASHLAPPQS